MPSDSQNSTPGTTARAAAHNAELLAKEIAWQDRSHRDASCNPSELWENLAGETRGRYLASAKVSISFHERRVHQEALQKQ